MTRCLLMFLLVCCGNILMGQTTAQKLHDYFVAAQKADLFNGSVLVVDRGKIVLQKGFGYKNAEAMTLNDQHTIYQIGSVTKQFTATVILKLAEQKKLSLNDYISKYFPGFPNAEKITIEHLLTHTSGIWNYTNDAMFMMKAVEKPIDETNMLALFRNKPLDFEPGTAFTYSNSAYVMLGYIIEKVTGKKYEQVVREEIFQPLNMVHSGFSFTGLNSTDKATGYQLLTTGNAAKALQVDSSVSFSAGAMYSNLDDLYKWNQSLQKEKILKQSSLTNAFTPRLEKYGLGWFIDTLFGTRVIRHNGGIHGFLTHNAVFPTEQIFITLLSNSNSSKMEQVGKDVEAILVNKPYKIPEIAKIIQVDTLTLRKYVGEYELAPTFKINIALAKGNLKVQATGQPQFDLFATTERLFFLKVVDAQIEFVPNDKGEITSLVLHQGGVSQVAKKIK